jgi:hypothetical protein
MHLFRRLIALLLIVTLPAYAWAALGLPEACPMQTVPAAEMTAAGHACCEVAEAAHDESPQPGKSHPCKPGQQCKTGSLYHLQVPPTARVHITPGTLAAATEIPILSRDPTGVWRPPRSL